MKKDLILELSEAMTDYSESFCRLHGEPPLSAIIAHLTVTASLSAAYAPTELQSATKQLLLRQLSRFLDVAYAEARAGK